MRAISGSRGKGVLILVENLSVPFDRRVWQEARSLVRAGYEVSVICPKGNGRDREPYLVLDDVEIYRYPLAAAAGGIGGYVREYTLAYWHTRRLARRVAKSRDIRVVHACNPPDLLLLAALSLRRRGAAFVFDHHDLVPELYLSRFGRGMDMGYRLTRAAERLTFRLADVVLSTNESYRGVALSRGGNSRENVFVVRSAPDRTRFDAVDPTPNLKREKEYLIAYVGVMGPQDGVDHALRALAELRRMRSDWHAIFVGGGDVFDAMRKLSRTLGVDDVVEFTGRVPDRELLEVLSTADVGLAPDPKNPLNDVSTMNKILEYMAVGLPIVSYDLREARESAAGAAVYARPNEPSSLASQIDELLDAPERRHEMSLVGRHRIGGELSWTRSETQLLAAYERAEALAARRLSGAASVPTAEVLGQ